MFEGNGRQIAVHEILHAGTIARFDPPDETPDDAGGSHLGFEASNLSVVFALHGIEGEPRNRRRAPSRAGRRNAVADDASDGVIGDRKIH